MKKILSIVFLVIPLLLFTSACGEETQAKVTSNIEQIAPVIHKAVERTVEAVEAAETATMEAVESVVNKKEEAVVESTEVVVEEEKPVAEPVPVKEEKPVAETIAVAVKEEKPVAETVAVAVKEETAVKPVAMAAPNPEGAKLFSQNCAACHAGGRNLVNAMKTLKKEALVKYDMYSKGAIAYQVTNGKNAMPAFGNRLSSEKIEHLANYVLAQADKGW